LQPVIAQTPRKQSFNLPKSPRRNFTMPRHDHSACRDSSVVGAVPDVEISERVAVTWQIGMLIAA
jgi:hypothetical protein